MILGHQRWTRKTFEALAKEFESFHELEPKSSIGWDYVQEDGTTLADWAIEKGSNSKYFTFGLELKFPFHLFRCSNAGEMFDLIGDTHSPGALVFNAGHVWALRQNHDGTWFVLDSQSGGPKQLPKPATQPCSYLSSSRRHCSVVFTAKGIRARLLPSLRGAMRNFMRSCAPDGCILIAPDHSLSTETKSWISFFAYLGKQNAVRFDEPPKNAQSARRRVHSVLGNLMLLLARYIRALAFSGDKEEAIKLGKFIVTRHELCGSSIIDLAKTYQAVFARILVR